MNPDYLDLLLDRATGAVPLAEPRIAPSTLGAEIAPAWQEITEEIFQTRPALAVEPQPDTQPLRNNIRMQQVSPVAPRPEVEKSRDPEIPPALAIKERIIAITPDHATDSTPPAATRSPAPAPRELRTAPHQGTANREEKKASAHGPLSPTPSIAPAAPRAEMPSSKMLSDRAVEPTIQTQRLFPPASATHSAHNSDRLITAAPKPAQPAEPAPISIRIDRIEVRAGGPVPPSVITPKPRPSAPLGLDEYLKRKSGGDR